MWGKLSVKSTKPSCCKRLIFHGTSCAFFRLNVLPKSASLSSPRSLMSKFWGFRSLCNTFRLWQYASPRRIWNKKIWNQEKNVNVRSLKGLLLTI